MKAETHVTVEQITEREFISVCSRVGVTPLRVRNHILGRDEYLTSSVGVPMRRIVQALEGAGAKVVRRKIEVMKPHKRAAYYETHIEDAVEVCQSTVYNLRKGTCKSFRTERSKQYSPGWEAAVFDTDPEYDGMWLP